MLEYCWWFLGDLVIAVKVSTNAWTPCVIHVIWTERVGCIHGIFVTNLVNMLFASLDNPRNLPLPVSRQAHPTIVGGAKVCIFLQLSSNKRVLRAVKLVAT